MSSDEYLITRAHLNRERITPETARRIYDEAAAREDSELTGDVETGFAFWSEIHDGLKLVRVRVTPATDDETDTEVFGENGF